MIFNLLTWDLTQFLFRQNAEVSRDLLTENMKINRNKAKHEVEMFDFI